MRVRCAVTPHVGTPHARTSRTVRTPHVPHPAPSALSAPAAPTALLDPRGEDIRAGRPEGRAGAVGIHGALDDELGGRGLAGDGETLDDGAEALTGDGGAEVGADGD